jgi:putative nucleotidyltransferase with HDIG domain
MPRRTLALTLQSRLGRRIVLLFVISALLPVLALAAVGYAQVRRQLVTRAQQDLAQAAKSVGMGILDNLRAARSALEETALALRTLGRGSLVPESALGTRARDVFASFAVVREGGVEVLWGNGPDSALLAAGAPGPAGDRRPVIALAGADTAMVWLVVPLQGSPASLWAMPVAARVFGGAEDRASAVGAEFALCVRETARGRPVYCAVGDAATGERTAATWDVFLAYDYDAALWRVEVTLPLDAALAPALAFRRTFFATIIAVLGLVVWLSHVHVRRSLMPLTALRQGTQRLARRDFTGTVQVASHDEFEELAASFNSMAGELDRQFRTLTAVEAIDQAALTSARGEDVAATAARRLLDTLRCAAVDVCLAGERPEEPWHRVRSTAEGTRPDAAVRPSDAERRRLHEAVGAAFALDSLADAFGWLGPAENGPVLIVPLAGRDGLLGLVAVHGANGGGTDALLKQARQMGDKVAVGLSNARLIVRLDQLSYGALAALARTVDASSHWTAGHSERVTSLSLRMAERLGLDAGQRDALHRGGLLHDIGKIGIPPSILDKPGPLTERETARIREHPSVGARILAPIAAFADAIPIVKHHHEKVDGTGYPDGLRGEGIPYTARLLAVADVYDALVSSRPYRPGWSFDAALEAIRTSSGSHFDPVMVKTFLDVMADEGDAARFAFTVASEVPA